MRQSLKEHGHEEKYIQELDIQAQQEEKKWVTIRLKDVSESGKGAVRYFLEHLNEHHFKFGSSLMKQCYCCVSPPKKASEIPPKALKLTSRFFWHLGSIGEEFRLQKVT